MYCLILVSVCGQEVYVQNFTYTPDKTDDDNDNGNVNSNNRHRQEPFSYELENIVCEKPGSTNNTVMISAHYDSRMEDINNSTARAPGADDNASGVSALLEVARILSNVSLNYSIIFVLFSGEEQGIGFHTWSDGTLGSNDAFHIFYIKSTDGGSTFGSTINLSEDVESSFGPALESSQNNVYIVWSSGGSSPSEILYRESTDDGNIFGNTINLSNNPGDSNLPLYSCFKHSITLS